MNHYFRKQSFLFGKNERAFFELNADYVCLRALYLVDDVIFNTNIQVEKPNYLLPEGRFEKNKDLIQIEESEFLTIWNQSLVPFSEKWNQVKTKIPVGSSIEGSIVCFYPQGVILDLGLGFYGLADYEYCKAILGSEKMYPGNKIVLKVHSPDDSNMLILLR